MTEGQELEIAEGEIVEELPAPVLGNLFGTSDPAMVIEKASRAADALMEVVRAKQLVKRIKGHDHALVEAWTLLGSMLGVFPVVVWTHPIERNGVRGYEARVEARTLSGAVVGAAEAECLANEDNWRGRADYALRSMAQTRATSKALRMPLGFVMVIAGFEATPADEMDGVEPRSSPFAPPNNLPVNEVRDRVREEAERAIEKSKRKEQLVAQLEEFTARYAGDVDWSEEAVLFAAARMWSGGGHRPITTLNSLTVEELEAIIKSAKQRGVWKEEENVVQSDSEENG